MSFEQAKAEAEIEAREGKRDGFKKLMADPATSFMLSKLPPCEDLEAILKYTYERGFDCGSGVVTLSFLRMILKGPK
jgi:hypothetical protein